MIKAYFDGACEPRNPGGYMGMGFVVVSPNGITARGSRGADRLPSNTNNRAEWGALIDLLSWMRYHPECEVSTIYGDSKLVINQIKGRWKVKAKHLVGLIKQAKSLLGSIPYFVKFKWIPRDDNILADTQSKLAIMNVRPTARQKAVKAATLRAKHLSKTDRKLLRDIRSRSVKT